MKNNIIWGIAAALCIFSSAASAQQVYYPYSYIKIFNDPHNDVFLDTLGLPTFPDLDPIYECAAICDYEEFSGNVHERWSQCEDLIREECQKGCKIVTVYSHRGGSSAISGHSC
jgi:hypothetical protein